jgi:hypothetical protein
VRVLKEEKLPGRCISVERVKTEIEALARINARNQLEDIPF